MTSDLRLHRIVRWILFAIPPSAGLCALWLGQDASWDLRNYHFYNPFAFLHDRLGYDVAVSHVATYYNPLMYIPFYYAVTLLPPKAVGFLLGLIPGCNIFLLYAIARETIGPRAATGTWLCLAAALVGFLGAVNLSEIGTSFGDNILSLFVLAAAWMIVRQRRHFATAGALMAAGAGLLAGAAFGLKQPFAIYAVGLCAAFFGLPVPFRRRFVLAFVFGLGVLTGAAATGGFWMVEMWERYGNPLFPYFNQYFQSPWGAPEPYRDERFLPQGALGWLMFPFQAAFNPMQVGEIIFRDLRLPVLYVLLGAWGMKHVVARQSGRALKAPRSALADPRSGGHFLLIFIVVASILWMKLFGVYRYIIVVELLAPLVIVLIWDDLISARRLRMALTVGSLCLLLITLAPGNWGRRPWAPDYFGVEAVPLSGHSLVLNAGFEPMAYMIPFFPPQVRFLRIQGYMTGPSDRPNQTDRLMQQVIADHREPMYILYRSFDVENAMGALSAYGLEVSGECHALTPHVEPQQEHPFYLCPIQKRIR